MFASETPISHLRQVGTLRGHEDAVNAVAFSPDGKRVVSGSRDNIVKIWDTATEAVVSPNPKS